jgi:hypothetical protein
MMMGMGKLFFLEKKTAPKSTTNDVAPLFTKQQVR